MKTDVGGRQFPDDEDRDCPPSVRLLAVEPTDAAASPRKFCAILFV